MKINNIQIIPPYGSYYLTSYPSVVEKHKGNHWVLVIEYVDKLTTFQGFLSYEEAISFITRELEKLEDLENET